MPNGLFAVPPGVNHEQLTLSAGATALAHVPTGGISQIYVGCSGANVRWLQGATPTQSAGNRIIADTAPILLPLANLQNLLFIGESTAAILDVQYLNA